MFLDAVLRRSFGAQVLALLAAAAHWQAAGVTQLVASVLAAAAFDVPSTDGDRTRGAPSPHGLGDRGAGDHATSAAWILARNPFDSVTPRPLDASSIVELGHDASAAVCKGVRAVIVAAASDPASAIAVVEADASHTRLVRIGDDIGGGRKVALIEWNQVVLSIGSQSCQMRMFQPKPSDRTAEVSPLGGADVSAPSGGTAALSAEIASKISRTGKNEFRVDRDVVDSILQNHAELMKLVRIVPEQENGRIAGVRLFGIRPGSLLGTLGLENGDILRSINGFDISSPENALQAYARLRTAEHLMVEVSRGGQKQNIAFDIR